MMSIVNTNSQDLSQNRQMALRTSMIFVTSLAAVFVGLRFFARGMRGVKYSWDDWTILFALPWLFVLMSLGILMVHYGLGTHQSGLTILQLVGFGKTLLAFECVYIFTAAIIKTSLLLMYVRAFDVRRIKVASVILESVVIAWAIAIITLCIFQCTPVAKAWNPTISGSCINLKGSFIGNAVPNIVTDVFILALPIHALWQLDTGFGLKVQLSFVFLLGSFVVFTAIYRFTTLFAFNQRDTTWTLATSCAWVVVEVASGVISVCLPTLGPLVQCGAWRKRSREFRAGSGMNSCNHGGESNILTQARVMGDVESGREDPGSERRSSSKEGDMTKLTAKRRLSPMCEETGMYELENRNPRAGANSDTDRESDGDIGRNGEWGLAPPPRNSMISRP